MYSGELRSLQFIVYSVQCLSYSVQCKVYSVQCTAYSVEFTVYSLQCTVCSKVIMSKVNSGEGLFCLPNYTVYSECPLYNV